MIIRDERIARGINLLDEVNPGWLDEINPYRLNINSASDCVLGQVYGNYHRGLSKLWGRKRKVLGLFSVRRSEIEIAAKSKAHGFYGREWGPTSSEWRAALIRLKQERRRVADWELIS